MDILSVVRPAIKILKAGEVKLNFGIKEYRLTTELAPEILTAAGHTKEDFLKSLGVNPNAALFKVLHDLIMSDWDSETDKPGSTLTKFLELLDIIFMTDEPLVNLQFLDILEKYDNFEETLSEALKKNSESMPGITSVNLPPKLSTTDVEKKPQKKKKAIA